MANILYLVHGRRVANILYMVHGRRVANILYMVHGRRVANILYLVRGRRVANILYISALPYILNLADGRRAGKHFVKINIKKVANCLGS